MNVYSVLMSSWHFVCDIYIYIISKKETHRRFIFLPIVLNRSLDNMILHNCTSAKSTLPENVDFDEISYKD